MEATMRVRLSPRFVFAAGSSLLAVVLVSGALLGAACRTTSAEAQSKSSTDLIARGEYLVTIGGCNDCHTPMKMGPNGPETDMSRMLSGHPESLPVTKPPVPGEMPFPIGMAVTGTAFAGPWGVSFTANLTPDPNTGIGIWTEDIFMKTLRTGKHWGVARPILPPMPWFNYGKMTDDDLKAVFAYLRSIPPIHNRVPEPLPPAQITEHRPGDPRHAVAQ
jgi:mono/diheme cytochrome c family protein